MIRRALLVFSTALLWACGSGPTAPPSAASANASQQHVHRLAPSRSISLSAEIVRDPSQSNIPASLTITQADVDEPSEGPSSFDVIPGKGFVVADPTRNRIVFYTEAGQYQQELDISVSPRHVRVLPNGALSVVRFDTDERYIYQVDYSGHYKAPRRATASDPDPDAADGGQATLESPQSAVLQGLAQPGREAALLAVRLDHPGESMVYVQRLGVDARAHTYVLIESSKASDVIAVSTSVREYSHGQVLQELSGITTDTSVEPEDPFRVRDGFVYQLAPKANEVRINVWDTNLAP